MAMNQFEFLGNDRYFKYRVFYELHKVGAIDVQNIYNKPQAFNNANVIIMPKQGSFFDGRQEYFSPSPVFGTARTIIVSAAPKKVLSTTMSFLNIDSQVLILTVSAVILLSLLLVFHSIVSNKFKSLPAKKVAKKLAEETMRNVWENTSLLCAEPIPHVLPHITCRLLVSSWLIGVTFILFFLGCFLRTEFTTESYNCIDTLSDLIKSGIPPIVVKGGGALDYLEYLAAKDPVVKKWLDALDKEKISSNLMDYLALEGYLPIISGEKALITEDTYLIWIMAEFLTMDSESKEFLVDNRGLFFSQHVISFEYLHLICNTSWMRSTPQLHENLQLSLEPIYETYSLDYLDFEKRNLIEQVKWKKPLKNTADLDLSSVFVPFYLLFMLLSGTVAVMIIEIFLNRFS